MIRMATKLVTKCCGGSERRSSARSNVATCPADTVARNSRLFCRTPKRKMPKLQRNESVRRSRGQPYNLKDKRCTYRLALVSPRVEPVRPEYNSCGVPM